MQLNLQAVAELDWGVAATIAAPIVALFIGAALNHFVQSKPRIITYLAHASSFAIDRPEGSLQINTHSVVLRNSGRKSASKVRLGHRYLPAFQVYPDIEYKILELPGGGKEILFPALIPKKQVTVSYLYFPPVTWDQINTHIESDEGPAKVINVLPTPQLPIWFTRLLWVFLIYGIIAIVYTAVEVYRWAAS